jgi:hypothetical protein
MQTSAVLETIIRVLSPYLGESMARASTRGVCEKLGMSGDSMRPEETEALVAKLASGLRVFVGREKADQAVEEIRRGLDGAGKTP